MLSSKEIGLSVLTDISIHFMIKSEDITDRDSVIMNIMIEFLSNAGATHEEIANAIMIGIKKAMLP